MEAKRLFTIGFAICTIMMTAACSKGTIVSEEVVQAENTKIEIVKYDKLAEEKNEELELVPIKLSAYSEETGSSLSYPNYELFAVNGEFTISAKIDKYEQLAGKYAWIKMRQKNSTAANNSFEYYAPIKEGEIQQKVHFFNGEGQYSVQIMLPSLDKENYYIELANFEVINMNPDKIRDITYTPNGFEAGLILEQPTSGYIEENGQFSIKGKLRNLSSDEQSIMLQLKKESDSWQHVIPIVDGSFSYDLPLFFGEGIHKVHVLVPDSKTEHRYQYGSTIWVENKAKKRMEPIQFHRDYETRGIQLENPKFGGDKTDVTYRISGNIDPSAPFASETTHLYIKTKKGQDEALDIIPVENYQFDSQVYLRFGPGEYKVTINVPEIKKEQSSYFSFFSVADFHVHNTAQQDQRDLLPSRGIQSEAPNIIALANEITKDKTTDREKAKAIYEYTAKNISYDVEKYENSSFQWDDSALKTLEMKTGVCQDYAYLAAALLRASDIEARFVTGLAGTGFLRDNHAWIEANIDGIWLVMDPTWGAGYVEKHRFIAKYSDQYFDPDETEFKKTHLRRGVEY